MNMMGMMMSMMNSADQSHQGGPSSGYEGGGGGGFAPMPFKGKGKGKGKGKRKGGPGGGPDGQRKNDPDADMAGKPGPNGEDPTTGRWSFESKGKNAGKRWKWKPNLSEEEIAVKRARKMYEQFGGAAAATGAAGQ
mmetsp:Transcript_914/g.1613  ORF Transcript_914/g.1613 Transcript_914/m.1613 type:complete len:136 (+) Transcript_914:1-408(+)